jgi:hypothetical protein
MQTDREKAQGILQRYIDSGARDDDLCALVVRAIRDEREACAKLADEWADLLAPAHPSRAGAAAQVAVEIRKRT